MSATGILYKLLYILLHNLFTAFLFFSNLSLALYQRFLDYYHMTTTPAGEVLYIKSHLINLTKIPNHVTFLLGPEEPSHQDLTNFIVWCVISGISFITLYDHEGMYILTVWMFKNKLPWVGCYGWESGVAVARPCIGQIGSKCRRK